MIYTIEGSNKIKAHHKHFAATVHCILDKIGNGQKGITSTKTFVETKLNFGRGFSSQQSYLDILANKRSKTSDKTGVMVIG